MDVTTLCKVHLQHLPQFSQPLSPSHAQAHTHFLPRKYNYSTDCCVDQPWLLVDTLQREARHPDCWSMQLQLQH